MKKLIARRWGPARQHRFTRTRIWRCPRVGRNRIIDSRRVCRKNEAAVSSQCERLSARTDAVHDRLRHCVPIAADVSGPDKLPHRRVDLGGKQVDSGAPGGLISTRRDGKETRSGIAIQVNVSRRVQLQARASVETAATEYVRASYAVPSGVSLAT